MVIKITRKALVSIIIAAIAISLSVFLVLKLNRASDNIYAGGILQAISHTQDQ